MMLAQGMGVESATARIRCSENSAAKGRMFRSLTLVVLHRLVGASCGG